MILVTVGTQLPFDRLVFAVDKWAKNSAHVDIFGQVAGSQYKPSFRCVDYLSGSEYEDVFDRASLVVAHAGMGTIITSLMAGKPVVVFPRKASLGEHRNEHQLATCENLKHLKGCYIAHTDEELAEYLDRIEELEGGSMSEFAGADLLSYIEACIENG